MKRKTQAKWTEAKFKNTSAIYIEKSLNDLSKSRNQLIHEGRNYTLEKTLNNKVLVSPMSVAFRVLSPAS